MNRSVNDAINLARSGRRVVFLAPSHTQTRQEFIAALPIEGSTATIRSVGRESVRFDSGGVIWFLPVADIRGMSVDDVYLDAKSADNPQVIANVVAMVTSPNSRLTIY